MTWPNVFAVNPTAGNRTCRRVETRDCCAATVLDGGIQLARALGMMKPFVAVVLFGLVASSQAAPVVTTLTDAEASKALDSVLEHVVIAKPALDASRTVGTAKGSLEITKDGGKPTIKGALTAGTEGKAGFQKRAIDWNFTTNIGSFSSIKRDATETTSVAVTGTANDVHQVSSTKGSAVERDAIIDSKTVTLKAGCTAPVVVTDEKITIAAAAAAVQFQATGQPALSRRAAT